MKKIILMGLLVLSLQFVVLASGNRTLRPGIHPIGYCFPDANPDVGSELYWMVVGYEGDNSIVQCFNCPPGCMFDFERQLIVPKPG